MKRLNFTSCYTYVHVTELHTVLETACNISFRLSALRRRWRSCRWLPALRHCEWYNERRISLCGKSLFFSSEYILFPRQNITHIYIYIYKSIIAFPALWGRISSVSRRGKSTNFGYFKSKNCVGYWAVIEKLRTLSNVRKLYYIYSSASTFKSFK
jgi:hypothetical protein